MKKQISEESLYSAALDKILTQFIRSKESANRHTPEPILASVTLKGVVIKSVPQVHATGRVVQVLWDSVSETDLGGEQSFEESLKNLQPLKDQI